MSEGRTGEGSTAVLVPKKDLPLARDQGVAPLRYEQWLGVSDMQSEFEVREIMRKKGYGRYYNYSIFLDTITGPTGGTNIGGYRRIGGMWVNASRIEVGVGSGEIGILERRFNTIPAGQRESVQDAVMVRYLNMRHQLTTAVGGVGDAEFTENNPAVAELLAEVAIIRETEVDKAVPYVVHSQHIGPQRARANESRYHGYAVARAVAEALPVKASLKID